MRRMMRPELVPNDKIPSVYCRLLSHSDISSSKEDLVIDARFITEDGGSISSKQGDDYPVVELTAFSQWQQGRYGKLCSLLIPLWTKKMAMRLDEILSMIRLFHARRNLWYIEDSKGDATIVLIAGILTVLRLRELIFNAMAAMSR
mmetsp:Transcript_1758/g.2872  ORF Transcript_1758/g.2872 Transcript_1758/m.2872 type:complete len:146 (+) Transcript_1758:80-517(+)